jgi:arylsulfatase A-like enzyme
MFAIGVIVFPWLLQRPRMKGAVSIVVAGSTSAVVVASLVLSFWIRHERPYNMLEVWGDTTVAGWAIDMMYDVQALRVDLNIEGIEPKPLPEATHANVVMITMDTVRADHVPSYGGKAKMPALHKLGKQGAVFERAYSPGNVTRRSLPTLATGISPKRMRGRVVGWALRMDPRHVLTAERFRAAGYDTAGFFCCRSHFGKDHKLGLIRGLDHVAIEYAGGPLAEQAVQWIQKRGTSAGKPLFLWAHFIEPHNWIKDHKPGPKARTKRERYNLSLEKTDEYLGKVVDAVQEVLGENTIIIVTADHGEGLGDHGIQHNSGGLYDSETRVPLLVIGPGIRPQRLKQAVGLVDVAPTLMELAGFEPPGMPAMDGLSVAPELLGTRKDAIGLGEAYSVMVADRSVRESQAAIMSGRYKLIERSGGEYELYDLGRDAKEKQNIKDVSLELFESMKARLSRRRDIDRVAPF